MTTLTSNVRDFVFGAVSTFVVYTLIVVNIRAIAHREIPLAMGTDAATALVNGLVIRRFAHSEGYALLAGTVMGGAFASWFGIWLTWRLS